MTERHWVRMDPELRIHPVLICIALTVGGFALYLTSEVLWAVDGRGPAHTLAVSLLVLAGVLWAVCSRWPDAGRWLAALSLVISTELAVVLLQVPGLQSLFALAIPVALTVVGLRAALLVVSLSSALLCLRAWTGGQEVDIIGLSIDLVLLWGLMGSLSVVYLRVSQASRWASDYQKRASQVLGEARQRKADLAQALQSLAQANRQLALAGERAVALRQAAEDARQAKADFVARVSHEFRTPLNMIIGMVGLMIEAPELYEEELAPDHRKDLEIVYRNCQHLSTMISDVLDLSRVEAGQFVLYREQADLPQMIEHALAAVVPLTGKKGLQVSMKLQPDLPQVFCDRRRILEVLLNLVSNAARVTDEGGITVEAFAREEHVSVRVTDTGPGIAPEAAERLFQPFAQVGGFGEVKGGSGLGLAISKQLVELHGGQIWLRSQPGVGSTFGFDLPINPEPEAEAAPWRRTREEWPFYEQSFLSGRAGVVDGLTRARVVVYDGEGVLVPDLQRYANGIEFVEVTGQAAMDRILRPGLAQTMLINATSLGEACTLLEGAARTSPDTLIVGCAVPKPAQESAQAGALGQLTKPIGLADLGTALESVGTPVRRVLTVDDDEEYTRLLTAMLAKCDAGLEVRSAASGERALEILRTWRPDLVFLDIWLPGQNGWEVLRQIKESSELDQIPVLMLSAQDAASSRAASPFLLAAHGNGLTPKDILFAALWMGDLVLGHTPAPGQGLRAAPGAAPVLADSTLPPA